MAGEWEKEGFVDSDFIHYVSNEKIVAFPWTMIDKITPRPSEQIADDLEKLGVEDMQPVITGKKTYIAPFVNAEKPQYLVIKDSFPNEYLGDTNLRLAVDVSQMVGIRFGEAIKAYKAKYGDASRLTAIPLGIAGWLRYMLAVDDEGKKYELAPDPMNEEIGEQLKKIMDRSLRPTGQILLAITGGATAFSHVNDSGFWLVNSMLEIDEKTTLKAWTMMETIIGFTGLICALIISVFA